MESTTTLPLAGIDLTSGSTPTARSRRRIWVGRTMSALPILFLLFDAAMKLLRLPFVLEATAKIGYPTSAVGGIGLLLFLCLIVHLIPRTAILGAVLLTGYLGGAVATHVRVGDPLGSHVLFPVYVAALIWGGLYLRDRRVRGLLAAR